MMQIINRAVSPKTDHIFENLEHILMYQLFQALNTGLQYGRVIISGPEIYNNFWENWSIFKRYFVEINGDDEAPRTISFCSEEISKAETSLKVAEKLVKPNMAFATLYQRIDVVKSDLSEADDFATVQPCLKLIRSLPTTSPCTYDRCIYQYRRIELPTLFSVSTELIHH